MEAIQPIFQQTSHALKAIRCQSDWRLRHLCLNERFNGHQQLGQTVFPLVWHVVQNQFSNAVIESIEHRVNLVHVDPSLSMQANRAFIVQALGRLANRREIWAPICSNHTYLLHCLGRVLDDWEDDSLNQLILVYVGDHGNESAFAQLAERAGMRFCFQALL